MSEIGSGAYGTVYSNANVASKVFQQIINNKTKEKIPDLRNAISEYAMTKSLADIPGIIVHHSLDLERATIHMPLYDTDLGKWLKQNPRNKLHHDWIIAEIMKIVHAVHRRGIVHSDLKPNNVLLVLDREKKPTQVIMTDFGISSNPKYAGVRNTAPLYQYDHTDMNLQQLEHDCVHDIYSLGILIMSMYQTEDVPPSTLPKETREAGGEPVVNDRRARHLAYQAANLPRIPVKYRELVKRMINVNPSERPTIDVIIHKLKIKLTHLEPHRPETVVETSKLRPDIDLRMARIHREYGTQRARLGCYALSQYLDRKELSPAELQNYVEATALVLESMFGSRRMFKKEESLQPWREKITELVNNQQFIKNLTIPTNKLTVVP